MTPFVLTGLNLEEGPRCLPVVFNGCDPLNLAINDLKFQIL